MIEGKWKIDRSYKNICIEMMTENLASLRAKADITQGEISNLIGISRQTYYAIETGQRTMSWNTYLSLLLFFDTNNSTRSMLRALSIIRVVLVSGCVRVLPIELVNVEEGQSKKPIRKKTKVCCMSL